MRRHFGFIFFRREIARAVLRKQTNAGSQALGCLRLIRAATVMERSSHPKSQKEIVPPACLIIKTQGPAGSFRDCGLYRISHQPQSAGGAKESSPGRKPWETSSSSQKAPSGAKENNHNRLSKQNFCRPCRGSFACPSASQHLRETTSICRFGLDSAVPLSGTRVVRNPA